MNFFADWLRDFQNRVCDITAQPEASQRFAMELLPSSSASAQSPTVAPCPSQDIRRTQGMLVQQSDRRFEMSGTGESLL